MNRRGFLQGILAAGVAPYVIRTSGLLMPIRGIVQPTTQEILEVGMYSYREQYGFVRTLWPGLKEFWDKTYADYPEALL